MSHDFMRGHEIAKVKVLNLLLTFRLCLYGENSLGYLT